MKKYTIFLESICQNVVSGPHCIGELGHNRSCSKHFLAVIDGECFVLWHSR